MSQTNKVISFVKKHKKKFIIGGSIYVALMVVLVIIGVIFIFNDSTDNYSYTATRRPVPSCRS